MTLTVTPEKLPISWKRDLAGKPERSLAFYMTLVLNGSCIAALIKVARTYRALLKGHFDLLAIFAVAILFLVVAAISMWQIYQKTRAELSTRDAPCLLVLSYIAFRLYLLVLGVAIMFLEAMSLAR